MWCIYARIWNTEEGEGGWENNGGVNQTEVQCRNVTTKALYNSHTLVKTFFKKAYSYYHSGLPQVLPPELLLT
jgi:hypothetical protein